jgi:hypothetical protein
MGREPKDSLDYQNYKSLRNWCYTLLVFISLISVLISCLPIMLDYYPEPIEALYISLICISIYAAVCLPFAFFYQSKMKDIKKISDLEFYTVTLDGFQDSSTLRVMHFCFSVTFSREGENMTRDTGNIFYTRSLFIKPALADYMNKTVTIGYSPSKDRVLVFPIPTDL